MKARLKTVQTIHGPTSLIPYTLLHIYVQRHSDLETDIWIGRSKVSLLKLLKRKPSG